VGDIARPFEMSLPAVSKHLAVLADAGLITRSKEGRVDNFGLKLRSQSA
jgi:DNA-binding transcriptional ArsR family regulator